MSYCGTFKLKNWHFGNHSCERCFLLNFAGFSGFCGGLNPDWRAAGRIHAHCANLLGGYYHKNIVNLAKSKICIFQLVHLRSGRVDSLRKPVFISKSKMITIVPSAKEESAKNGREYRVSQKSLPRFLNCSRWARRCDIGGSRIFC